jgi:Ca2+-binding EF-hand superfamily protein
MSDLKEILKKSFYSLDTNRNGVLEDAEALAFFESCSLHATTQFNRLLRKQFDFKQKALKITMDDVNALIDSCNRDEQESVEELRELFTKFDTNKTDKLESDEIKVWFSLLARYSDRIVSVKFCCALHRIFVL